MTATAFIELSAEKIALFFKKIDKSPGLGPKGNCWHWTASTDRKGYGQFSTWENGKTKLHRAHRISWLLSRGPFDPRLSVLHKCDNPKCVKPSHLFLGTVLDNNRDMQSKGRYARIGRPTVTKEQVLEIRKRHAAGESNVALGKEFGISESSASHITCGHTWKTVGGKTERRRTLSESEVVKIRELFSTGKFTRTAIAKRIGVSISCVGRVVSGFCHAGADGPVFEQPYRQKLTESEKQFAIEQTKAGKTQIEIAKILNIDRSCVSRVIRGVKRTRNKKKQ